MKKAIMCIISIMYLLHVLPAQAGLLSGPEPDIFLDGNVTDYEASAVAQEIVQLNKEAPGKEIVLHISSYGGSVYAGLKIYDAMMASASPIRTICEGQCMSMGAVLLAAGDVREAMPNATILTHQVGLECGGKLAEVINCAQEGARLEGLLYGILAAKSGQTLQKIAEISAWDHYMPPADALGYHLIDAIRQPLPRPAKK